MEEYHVVGDPKDNITVDRNGNIYVQFGESRVSPEMKKRLVCDFFANINPRERAVDLKAITLKYASYIEIDSEITRLSLQLAEEDRNLNSFFTFGDENRGRHRDAIVRIQQQREVLNNDFEIINNAYRDYETYLNNSGNPFYRVRKSTFFELIRNNCVPVAIATNVSLPVATATNVSNNQGLPVATATNDSNNESLPVATATSVNTGGRKSRRRKSIRRKSRKRKAKKSKKSRKTRK